MKCSVDRFAQMYGAVYRDLYCFALCMMKNTQEAEDMVSSAVLAAYENIHKLKNEEAFKNWIFSILANKCKKQLNHLKNQREKEQPASEANDAGDGKEPSVTPDYGLALDVRKAFFILSQEEQEIVAFSVFGGYNSTEIGRLLRLNANTVRSRRKRALEKMACVLE